MKMLWYEDLNGYEQSIVADKIVRFSKEEMKQLDQTLIHLINGECIRTPDSIKTLTARMENE